MEANSAGPRSRFSSTRLTTYLVLCAVSIMVWQEYVKRFVVCVLLWPKGASWGPCDVRVVMEESDDA